MLRLTKSLIIIAFGASLAACGDSNNNRSETPPEVVSPPVVSPVVTYEFTIQVSNLTAAQPLSPIAVISHTENMLWEIGSPASTALEVMAEGGNNSDLLAVDFATAVASADAPLPPGSQVTLSLSTEQLDSLKISLATMLVNTNDAFTGLNAIDVSSLAVDEALTFTTFAYDAGTEANSEAAGTIPGPADSGEGFNEERNDVNYVAMHPGVVSQHDGLSSSVLSSQHKFDNPLTQVVITRTQ
ncbi:spondin domain-containing protein [Pseudoalteromonas sp. L1]|uniref:spondin domain-containing protein n=1 Tax=Pseudoalteromonas sp. L1 TaxID=195716 RepID=UPI001F426641|nr:spondin domain-containing protein [Pseudoalteromonas sp. L1]